MSRFSRSVLSGRLVLLAALLYPAAPVSASTLQIWFTSLNLTYDGSKICDSGGSNSSRVGNTSQADRLAIMDFFVDGSQVGRFYSIDNLFADICIPGVFNIHAAGDTFLSQGPFPGFGFDLFIGSTVLALNIDSPFEIVWVGDGNLTITTTAGITSIEGQALPFGLTLDTPVYIRLEQFATEFGTEPGDDGDVLTRFSSFGTGDVGGLLAVQPCAFADNVVSFTPGSGTLDTSAIDMLGAPDGQAVSLGIDGVVVLRMSDWIGDEPGIDFYVDENGAAVDDIDENYRVEVGQDGINFGLVGEGAGGSVGFDLAGSGYGSALFIRITDLSPQEPLAQVPNLGADIDAVRVMHCASAPPVSSEPTTWSLLKQRFGR